VDKLAIAVVPLLILAGLYLVSPRIALYAAILLLVGLVLVSVRGQ